ncbi:hypothetical protein C1Y63_08985 [Corynebacterium sp. 13CS0277]|uniref:hypothetical protein n=1 Tax=Corynebacterium sp. 13CS0277 TaxID=2071994 RepID=UPI000D045C4C|nr:hypothetical protein [Corynebacterium sp. 13CS0277]PRQ10868.1 hypothetical protein C1Y63_08985 [Corynebacterium sp. 13CS0277]
MKARVVFVSALCATALATTGCSQVRSLFEEAPPAPQGASDITPTETAAPVFTPTPVEPVVAETFLDPTFDPGLNTEWELMGAEAAPLGGVVLHLNLKNLNDMPLPPGALPPAVLLSANNSGNMMEIEPLGEDASGVFSGLDLPLGAGATTTVDYAFSTTIGNLYQAELHAGNVIFKGNLNV